MVKKILLVDDHPAIRASIGAELLKKNITETVFEAGNSEEGFDQAMVFNPDLIVMDISLYGASGIELTKKILQKNPKINPTTPMIIPILAISWVWTRPVDAAMAFGGVEIGKHIAMDAQTAIKTIIARVPPRARNETLFEAAGSAIPVATTIRIGIRRAAVAELLMKFDRK